MDNNQSLSDGLSVRPHLEKLFYKEDNLKKIALFHLDGTYRCPEEMIKLANRVLHIKRHLYGGVVDKLEDRGIKSALKENKQGYLDWSTTDDEKMQEALSLRIEKSHQTVVIIPDDSFRQEAEGFFNSTRIYTIEQIKGLEYQEVIGYRLFESPKENLTFREANRLCLAGKMKDDAPEHLRMRGEQCLHHQSVARLNRLFTAITRAEASFRFVNKEIYPIKDFVAYMREGINPKTDKASSIKPISPLLKQATKKDWHREITENLKRGNVRQAKGMFFQYNISSATSQVSAESEFKKILDMYLPIQVERKPTVETSGSQD
jgi:hypothetical protein